MKPSQSDLALEVLHPKLSSRCRYEPDAVLNEILALRAWVRTLPSWRTRRAYLGWLKYFEKNAKEAIRDQAKNKAIRDAVQGFPKP